MVYTILLSPVLSAEEGCLASSVPAGCVNSEHLFSTARAIVTGGVERLSFIKMNGYLLPRQDATPEHVVASCFPVEQQPMGKGEQG